MKKRSNLTNQNSCLRWKKVKFVRQFYSRDICQLFCFYIYGNSDSCCNHSIYVLSWYNWWKQRPIFIFFIFFLFVGLSIFAFNWTLPALFVVAAEDKWGIALACYCHQRRRLYLQTNNGPIENHYFANKQEHSRINGAPVIKHLLGL